MWGIDPCYFRTGEAPGNRNRLTGNPEHHVGPPIDTVLSSVNTPVGVAIRELVSCACFYLGEATSGCTHTCQIPWQAGAGVNLEERWGQRCRG